MASSSTFGSELPLLGRVAPIAARIHPGFYALFAGIALTVIGVLAIGTVSPTFSGLQWQRQLPIAILAMMLVTIPHPRWIGMVSYSLLAASIVLLIFLLLPGVPRGLVPIRNGARSWINLGFMSMQPSEITKIAFVLAVAWYLRYRESYRSLLGLVVPFALMFVPVALILKQPDLGTALLFAPALFAMLIAAGAKMRHIMSLLLLGFVAIGLNVAVIVVDPPHERESGNATLPAWAHIMKPHQEKRIASMIWPDRYKQTEAFQQTTSIRLVGAGGLTGNGQEQATTLVKYNGLPEPHNDMIFAVIVNRWGAMMGVVVLVLYLVLCTSMMLVAGRSKDPFGRLVCVGFAAIIFVQAMINIGMSVGLMPVTGITLPFISYGGSSLLATFIMVGLILNFAARRPQMLARPSFEFDNGEAIYQ